MLRGLYSAAGALEAASRNQEIVAENISHATTPGYRRQALLFEALDDGAASSDDRPAITPSQTGPKASFTYFESGPLARTQNPLDVALVGDAFFVVDGPNGPLYTRNGGFELSSTGQLQMRSGGGYRVRGQGGPITLPPTTARIVVSSDGTVSADNVTIGSLEFATFAQPSTLRRVGGSLFEGDAPQAPAPGVVRVEQGYREGSNVQVVQEMVSMMVGMRYYEAAEKAMRSISDAIGQNTRIQP